MSESQTVEASGPDIESAISTGIAELGVSRGDVMVEILDEPTPRGLFGLGGKQARVRLTVIRAPRTAAVPPAASTTSSADSAPIRQPERLPERPERRPSSLPGTPKAPPRGGHDELDEAWSDDGDLSEADLAEDAKVGAETLQELLGYLQFEAKVVTRRAETADDEPQHWTLEIQGRELGALIGRRGETLAALQYITRLIASRDLERRAHIVVDVEGYKSRRETMLRRLATKMAEQAVQRGKTVSLEPMPPHERRIIHLALRDNPDVTTESVGERDRRKVTIVPRRPQ